MVAAGARENDDGSCQIWDRNTLCVCVTHIIANCVSASRFSRCVCVFALAECLNSSALVAHVRRELRLTVFTGTQWGQDSSYSILAQVCAHEREKRKGGKNNSWARARGVLVNVLCHFLEWKQQFSYCGNVRLQQRSPVKRLHSSLCNRLLVFSGCLDWCSTQIDSVKQRLQADMFKWSWTGNQNSQRTFALVNHRKLLVYWK